MHHNSSSDALSHILGEMRQIKDSVGYYAITNVADEDGKIVFSCQTHWVGWGDQDFRTEIRAPSLVDPYKMTRLWTDLGEPYLIVNSPRHFYVYCLLGGHALLSETVANEYIADYLEPEISARSGRVGFVSASSLGSNVFRRAPTPKQRMRVFKRDGFRCRICGRSPSDHSDVELHIHHIRPWAHGGLSEDKNLITLCHTCHNGLEPHEDHSLFDFISPNELARGGVNSRYLQSVDRYREAIWETLRAINTPESDHEHV